MKTYKTGAFAKMANVSERTIRYYDKIGLLKPSFVLDNGYRQYTEKDLFILQQIIALRHFGFSLDEIYPMINAHQDMKQAFDLQIELIDSKIQTMQAEKEALISMSKTISNDSMNWDKMLQVVQMFNQESKIVEHYKHASHLDARIHLHDQFSVNPQSWFEWLYTHIDFSKINRLLEVGCGNGKLWEENHVDLRNREIFLSDVSFGMVDTVRKKLGQDFNCIVVDCQNIPFKDGYFDALVANHVLFYVQDLSLGLQEIQRVLKKNGLFYCSAYGSRHMHEISDLCKEFDSHISLSETRLDSIFGIENGKDILQTYFKDVQYIPYEDHLEVDQVQPLVDYILSCHGNQNEILGPRLQEFITFLQDKIDKNGKITITKETGLFISKK